MDLRDKVAVITGASSGIGAATARALASHGCRVTLVARRVDRLGAVAAEIEAAGGDALVATADVRREDDIREAFSKSQDRWGQLDILVNNAGVGRSASLIDGATEHWKTMIEVNLLALAIAQREALARFDRQAGGHIVNIASMSAHRVPPSGGFYSATKFAVRAMTEALRLELRQAGNPSRVSEISPGFVRTEFHQGLSEEARTMVREQMDSMRDLTAEDIADSVIHVVSAPDHVAIHDVLLRSNDQVS